MATPMDRAIYLQFEFWALVGMSLLLPVGVFVSEYSVALYLLPLIMAGMGINLMSHILHEHVIIAELEYERQKGQAKSDVSACPRPSGGRQDCV